MTHVTNDDILTKDHVEHPYFLTSFSCHLEYKASLTLYKIVQFKCDEGKNGFFPNSYYKAASHRFITFCIGGREYLTPQPPVLLIFLFFTPEASTDLAFLCSLPLGAEWRNLGTRLLVPEHQLNAIQAVHAYSPNHLQDCLNSMFAFWLNNCVEPTCEFLIQAVDAMGRRDVVTVLRQKYYGELVATPGERGSY